MPVRSIFPLFLLLLSMLLLGGCAAPAKVTSMTSMATAGEVVNSNSVLRNKTQLDSVVGGETTNPLWTSEIDNESYAQAVRDSLKFAGLSALAVGSAEYLLDVELVSIEQPLAGFSMTVTVTAEYKLYRASDRTLVWSDRYTTPYTAKVEDAFLGVRRLQLANEGSAKANIEMLIDALLRLKAADIQAG